MHLFRLRQGNYYAASDSFVQFFLSCVNNQRAKRKVLKMGQTVLVFLGISLNSLQMSFFRRFCYKQTMTKIVLVLVLFYYKFYLYNCFFFLFQFRTHLPSQFCTMYLKLLLFIILRARTCFAKKNKMNNSCNRLIFVGSESCRGMLVDSVFDSI